MMDRKTRILERLRQQQDTYANGAASASGQVIALNDLRMGAEAEIERLKTQLASLTAAVDTLRAENQKLTADKEILTAELLEGS